MDAPRDSSQITIRARGGRKRRFSTIGLQEQVWRSSEAQTKPLRNLSVSLGIDTDRCRSQPAKAAPLLLSGDDTEHSESFHGLEYSPR
jgi:hypothetical protein